MSAIPPPPGVSLNTGLTGNTGPPKPWEIFDWEDDHKYLLYTQWAIYYQRLGLLNKALEMLDKAVELKEDCQGVLCLRSAIKRALVQPMEALIDGTDAQELNPMNVKASLEVCDALYEANRFEECFSELNDNNVKFPDKSGDGLRDRIDIVHQNFMDALGHNLVEFFDVNKDIIPIVFELNQEKLRVDDRPLWKILKEQGKCDVLSIPEIDPEILSPLEKARRKRCFKVFCQIYINRGWIDVECLKNLRTNKNLTMSGEDCLAGPKSDPLHTIVETKYRNVMNFLKMLHTRSPLYNEKPKMCPNRRACKIMQRSNLYHIQYSTRRTMFIVLKTAKKLRADGEIEKLISFVEDVMGNWVVIKTNRIMPWKFEFINEVYNVLALAHADQYTIPHTINRHNIKHQLKALLNLPIEVAALPTTVVFGDRSTFTDADVTDYKNIANRKLCARLERRLRFAKYPIEQCYLRFEIARLSLTAGRLKECEHWAKKAIESADMCNHRLWKFLSTMLICKEHASQHKIEPTEVMLQDLQDQARNLRDPNLCAFIEKCRYINNVYFVARKNASINSQVTRKSKLSSEFSFPQLE